MGSKRTHVVIPENLIAQIDALVGPRGRSAFLVETARAELRKRALLAFLESDGPAWKDEDHPELAAMGTQAWLEKMRAPGEERLRRLHDRMRQADDPAA
jgi:hypothetical protein